MYLGLQLLLHQLGSLDDVAAALSCQGYDCIGVIQEKGTHLEVGDVLRPLQAAMWENWSAGSCACCSAPYPTGQTQKHMGSKGEAVRTSWRGSRSCEAAGAAAAEPEPSADAAAW